MAAWRVFVLPIQLENIDGVLKRHVLLLLLLLLRKWHFWSLSNGCSLLLSVVVVLYLRKGCRKGLVRVGLHRHSL